MTRRLLAWVAVIAVFFSVLPWDRINQAPIPGVTPTTLTFDLESPQATSQQVLNLGIENLVPGEYQVEITLTDLQRGTTRSRATMVEIGSPRQRR